MPQGTAIVLLLLLASFGQAQELLVPHEHHEWAAFPQGSWKQVRRVTASFKAGEADSLMTTTLSDRLKEGWPDYIVLEREAKSEVSGQVFEKPVREFRSGINGQQGTQRVKITPGGEQKLTILGKAYPCEVRNMEIF